MRKKYKGVIADRYAIDLLYDLGQPALVCADGPGS